jgi:hypothetical protein
LLDLTLLRLDLLRLGRCRYDHGVLGCIRTRTADPLLRPVTTRPIRGLIPVVLPNRQSSGCVHRRLVHGAIDGGTDRHGARGLAGGGIETGLDQVLALGLGDERLQLGGRESVDESGLGDDEQEDLGAGQGR